MSWHPRQHLIHTRPDARRDRRRARRDRRRARVANVARVALALCCFVFARAPCAIGCPNRRAEGPRARARRSDARVRAPRGASARRGDGDGDGENILSTIRIEASRARCTSRVASVAGTLFASSILKKHARGSVRGSARATDARGDGDVEQGARVGRVYGCETCARVGAMGDARARSRRAWAWFD